MFGIGLSSTFIIANWWDVILDKKSREGEQGLEIIKMPKISQLSTYPAELGLSAKYKNGWKIPTCVFHSDSTIVNIGPEPFMIGIDHWYRLIYHKIHYFQDPLLKIYVRFNLKYEQTSEFVTWGELGFHGVGIWRWTEVKNGEKDTQAE